MLVPATFIFDFEECLFVNFLKPLVRISRLFWSGGIRPCIHLFINQLASGDSKCPRYIIDELSCFHKLHIIRWDNVEIQNENTYAIWFDPLRWNYSDSKGKFLKAMLFSISVGISITNSLDHTTISPDIFKDLLEERWSGSSTLLRYLRAHTECQIIRDKMQDWHMKIGNKPGVYKVPEIGTIYYTKTFCYIDSDEGLILYDYIQVLMLHELSVSCVSYLNPPTHEYAFSRKLCRVLS